MTGDLAHKIGDLADKTGDLAHKTGAFVSSGSPGGTGHQESRHLLSIAVMSLSSLGFFKVFSSPLDDQVIRVGAAPKNRSRYP